MANLDMKTKDESVHFLVYDASTKPERVEYLLVPKESPSISPDPLQMVDPFSFLGLKLNEYSSSGHVQAGFNADCKVQLAKRQAEQEARKAEWKALKAKIAEFKADRKVQLAKRQAEQEARKAEWKAQAAKCVARWSAKAEVNGIEAREAKAAKCVARWLAKHEAH